MPASSTVEAASGGPAAYDLHLHSRWSFDGEVDVVDHFRRAQELRVRCLAITEHNHMDSAGEVLAAAGRYPKIRVVLAAELTARTSVGAVDLLCYHLPAPPTPSMRVLFETYRGCQEAMGDEFSRGMQAIGVDFNDACRREVLASYRPSATIERHGLTRPKRSRTLAYFLDRGWARDPAHFDKLCEEAREAVSGLTYPDVGWVREVVHEAQGLVVLAHPPVYCKDADRERLEQLRAECGLDGMECAHPRISADLSKRYRAFCVERGLLSTAGSDSHTPADVAGRFAMHGGEGRWLDEFLERLPVSA